MLDVHSFEIHSEITNYGNGPARNLDITLELLPGGLSHRVIQRTLPPGVRLDPGGAGLLASGSRLHEFAGRRPRHRDWSR